MATIQDVADFAGVSRAAVSKVIRNAYGVSPDMRERVTAAIESLGYRPSINARSLRGSSFTIGIEIPLLTNPFLTKVLEGATTRLDGSGYQLILAPSAPGGVEGKKEIEALMDRQVAGLIVISPIVSVEWLEEHARTLPTVMIGRHDDTDAYDTVTGDDVLGTRLMMEHLFGRGHRKIAHLTVREEVTRDPRAPHGARIEEYKRLMSAAGAADNILIARVELGNAGAYERTREILALPDRPTAIFAGSDFMAVEALRAVADAGLSTRDVAISGYDEIPIAGHPAISLTTIDQHGLTLGSHAAELLLERIAGRSTATHVQVTPRLIERGSTAGRF